MFSVSCLLAIQNRFELLTPVEQRIASYISGHGNEVVYMSVKQLADKTGTAKSAVVRCCKSLGFTGFPELKISLAADLSKNKELNYLPYINHGDDESAILDKIFSSNVKTLHDTAERIDRKLLKQLVQKMAEANNIYIYGVGTSVVLIDAFQYRLMQAGFHAQRFSDVVDMKVSTLNIRPGDIAVGISHSGRTHPVIEALQLAKDQGAVTACITSYLGSPITENCDYALAVYSDEIDYPMEAISSRIAHLSLIDAISIALSARDYDEATERAKSVRNMVNSIRD